MEVGDKIPHFTSTDSKGNAFDSQDYTGKFLVIYFYPKNETRVCTEQACSFRDQYEDFKALGAEVIGISSDSVKSHQKFTANHHLPFILLSDDNKKLRKLFGVPNDYLGLIPGRTTYVTDKNGVVQLIFDSTSGKIHIEKALEMLKTL
ncbi:peroxiredoxin [Flavobacterium terrisoli]|uniref:peroxiredoxin n=1 Tax=Flavobacterium terrisoli TaxID=3242195 RepID=UPI002542C537|nr:peroxiredoxin [Flavobacterium buctense]